MDFEQRLDRAIERGRYQREAAGKASAQAAMSEEDFRNRHSRGRLDLSEHIEEALKAVADRFPGFEYSTVATTDGWGASIRRDDISAGVNRQVQQLYSHLQLLVKPYTATRILELTGRAAIRNKELFARTQYQMLAELDVESFGQIVDNWVLEFAERYSRNG